MDSQEATVKFRFEIDTNGIRAINAMTGEVVKLASAEEIAREKVEAYNRAAKDRAQVGVPQAPATPAQPRTSPTQPAPAPAPAARTPEPIRRPLPPGPEPVPTPAAASAKLPELPARLPIQPSQPSYGLPIQQRLQAPLRELPPIPPPNAPLPGDPRWPSLPEFPQFSQPKPQPLPELPVRSADRLPIPVPPPTLQRPPLTPPVPLQPPPVLQPAPRLMDRVNSFVGYRPPGSLGIDPQQLERMNRLNEPKSPQRAEAEARGDMARLSREMAALTLETRLLRETYGRGGGNGTGGGAPANIGTSTDPKAAKEPESIAGRVRKQLARDAEDREYQAELHRAKVRGDGGLRSQAMALGTVAMGTVGVGLGAFAAAGQYAGQVNQITRNPWTTEGDKQTQKAEAVPITGWMVAAGRNIGRALSDNEKLRAQTERMTYMLGVESKSDSAIETFRNEQEFAKQRARGDAFGENLREPQMLGRWNLGTLRGERMRREDLIQLPVREQYDTTISRRKGIGEEITGLRSEDAFLFKKIGGLVKTMDENMNDFQRSKKKTDEENKPLEGSAINAAQNALRIRDEIVALNEERLKTVQKIADREKEARMTGIRESSFKPGGAEWSQNQMAVWQGREQRSVSQATALGMAGPEQRALAQQSLEALKQVGIENAPQELISQAASLFGEEVRKMAEQAGSKMMPDFKRAAPEEYRYGVEESRGKIDELRDLAQKAAVRESQQMAEAVNAVVVEYAKTIADHFAAVMKQRDKFADIQKILENSSSNK